ncbi:hypothetical protein [Nostoc sp. FACHB-888]|uniref:hypothetical protein n=1 Tax=Nostoc sp. FACHB-888 TaxID=2692842 RepID=UPI00168716D9|nr:hypothetical protein [Nostoc sp. FACHB-888]MBD2244863.1 hypothetical protein [Nostoc sp. FACHB-888]
MTPSIADKTPIPAKVWRRHTDPPGLWISVVIGSVCLHLLAFWLMRSSNAFSLWFPQQSQSAVPIELIDIAPTKKSTARKVSPKPVSSTKKSVPARLPQIVRTTPKDQDLGAINSADNLQPKSQIYASKPSSQPFRQQRVSTPTSTTTTTATPKPTPTPTSTPTPIPKSTPTATSTPTSTVPVNNLPWNRRQEIKLGRGTALPTGIPSNPPVSEAENRETPPTLTQETPPTASRETPSTPSRETPSTPSRETPPTPTGETPSTPSRETPPTPIGGASVAIVAPLLRDEVSNLIQSGRLRQDALPDVIASYRGSNAKQLDSSFLPRDSEVKPAQILASLIIDRNGNFQQAQVLEIEPATLQSEKSIYEQLLNDVFKTENFLAAHNNDGTKPDLSNLFVRIKIQPVNSN